MALIGIHGLGRIGRAVLRASLDSAAEVVTINDFTDDSNLLYLTRYDSIHGRFPVPIDRNGGSWWIQGRAVARYQHAAIDAVPWADHGVQIVIDASGATSARECRAVLDSGVRAVLITRPEPEADLTVIAGCNEYEMTTGQARLVSTSTCDANAAALVIRALGSLPVARGALLTLHPWLGYQNLLDGPTEQFPIDRRDDFSLGRASGVNLIPKQTSLLAALEPVLPAVTPRLTAMSYRVPTHAVSSLNLTLEVEGAVSAAEVNALLAEAAGRGAPDGPLSYQDDPLVSIDYLGATAGAAIDARWTQTLGGAGSTLVRLVAWYDNEVGYAHQVLRVAAAVTDGKADRCAPVDRAASGTRAG